MEVWNWGKKIVQDLTQELLSRIFSRVIDDIILILTKEVKEEGWGCCLCYSSKQVT